MEDDEDVLMMMIFVGNSKHMHFFFRTDKKSFIWANKRDNLAVSVYMKQNHEIISQLTRPQKVVLMRHIKSQNKIIFP